MAHPLRYQHRRWEKGSRKPPGTFAATRGSHLGNPFAVEVHGREEAIRLHQDALLSGTLNSPVAKRRGQVRMITCEDLRKFKGRPIGCACRLDEPCHVDTLLEIANGT
jgi:hypothetical protein